jgi:hypothetical protein
MTVNKISAMTMGMGKTSEFENIKETYLLELFSWSNLMDEGDTYICNFRIRWMEIT